MARGWKYSEIKRSIINIESSLKLIPCSIVVIVDLKNGWMPQSISIQKKLLRINHEFKAKPSISLV